LPRRRRGSEGKMFMIDPLFWKRKITNLRGCICQGGSYLKGWWCTSEM
jgi:hypothetical protein